MHFRRKTLRSRGEQPVARRAEQGGARGDRYRSHPAAGAALAQPRRFRQDVPDIEFGAALQAGAEGPGLIGGPLVGEAEQVQIPAGHQRGAGVQLLHPGKPADPTVTAWYISPVMPTLSARSFPTSSRFRAMTDSSRLPQQAAATWLTV